MIAGISSYWYRSQSQLDQLFHKTGLLPVFRDLLKLPTIGNVQVEYQQTCDARRYIEVY